MELNYHFNTETFKDIWQQWKEFRKIEKKKPYKTLLGEQWGLNNVYKLSQGNEEIAIKIIEQSMGQGWQGFFALPKGQMPVVQQNIMNTLQNSKILTTLSAAEQAKIEMRNELGFN